MKKLLLIGLFFLTPLAAHASTQVLIGGTGNVAGTNTTKYSLIGTSNNNNSFTSVNSFPVGGTISNLYIYLPSGTGVVGTRTFTLAKDLTNTTVVCTVGFSGNTCTDATHSFAVQAGDTVIVATSVSGTPVASEFRWSAVFTPTNANDTIITTSDPNNGSSVFGFMSPYAGMAAINASIPNNSILFPEGGTLDLLNASSTSIISGSFIYSIMQNGATSTLACTNDTTTAFKGCVDNTHSLTIAAGDTFTFGQSPFSPGTSSKAGFGVRFVPTTAGDFILPGSSIGASDVAGATRYLALTGASTFATVEASTSNAVAAAMTITSMSLNRVTAPGAAKNATITLRDNGSDTSLSCTLTGTGSGNGITTKTCTGSVSIAADDILDVSDTLTTGGTVSALRVSVVASTGSPAPTGIHANVIVNLAQWIINGAQVLIY